MSRYQVKITIVHTLEIEAESARNALGEARAEHERLRHNKNYNAPEASTIEAAIINQHEEYPED